MIYLLLFLLGFFFLLCFSIVDIKKHQIENKPILSFFFIGIIFSFFNNQFWINALGIALFSILGYTLWTKNSLGGADVKILTSLPPYLNLFGVAEMLVGLWTFLILFLIISVVYAFFFKIFTKKSKIPFVPAIFLTYLVFWLTKTFLSS